MGGVTVVHAGRCIPVACWDVMLCKVATLLRPFVTAGAGIPQNRVETLIGSQAKFEIEHEGSPFYHILLYYKKIFKVKHILKHGTYKINRNKHFALLLFHIILFSTFYFMNIFFITYFHHQNHIIYYINTNYYYT